MMLTTCQKNSQGQAITEYPLIMGLIAVVCIGLLITLGGNLSNMMNLIASGGGLGLGSVAQATLGANVNGGGSAPAQQNGGTPQPPPSTNPWQSSGNDQVATPPPASEAPSSSGSTIEINGKAYELPDPTDPNAIITAATRGGELTLTYMQQLLDMADEIEELLPDDPALADRIRDLANKGFDLAYFQQAVENICTTADQSCMADLVTFQDTGGAIYTGMHGESLGNEFEELYWDTKNTLQAASQLSAGDKEKLAAIIDYNSLAIQTINGYYRGLTETQQPNPDGSVTTYTTWYGFKPEAVGSVLTGAHADATCKTQSEHNCG